MTAEPHMAKKRSQYVTEELQYLLVIVTTPYDCYKSLARAIKEAALEST